MTVLHNAEIVLYEHISGCPRCADIHYDVPVYQFTEPVRTNEHLYSHFAICPGTDEPILIDVVDDNNISTL